MKLPIVSSFFFLCFLQKVNGARILGVFPVPSYSHHVLGSRLMEELASRGHQVTFIASYPQEARTNLKVIELEGFVEQREENEKDLYAKPGRIHPILLDIIVNVHFFNITEEILKHPQVQALAKSNEKFDAVILDEFYLHAMKGFCFLYKAPCISFGATGMSRTISSQIGNPLSPSYVPDLGLEYSPDMNFVQRMHNTFVYAFGELFRAFYTTCKHNSIMQAYFSDTPHLSDLYHNISMVILNSHVSTHQALAHVPNVVEVGGFHVKPPKKLSKDLQAFLDDAQDGVILFSTEFTPKSLHQDKVTAILKTFGKLKQRVLMKWEEETLPGKPDNVKLMAWLPQTDILAHPNVKLIINHGGLLSIMEAVYYGIPIIGIPLYGDQKANLINAVKNEHGLCLPYVQLTQDALDLAITLILSDPKYSANAKLRSEIMHDEPVKPVDKAIFWIEYAIKYRGAPHLRTTILNLYWYQYVLVDVGLFLIIAIVIILAIPIGFINYNFRHRLDDVGVNNHKKTS